SLPNYTVVNPIMREFAVSVSEALLRGKDRLRAEWERVQWTRWSGAMEARR
ncbi:hypothetical protein TorRG33x02_281660, partial [Trema orientale]